MILLNPVKSLSQTVADPLVTSNFLTKMIPLLNVSNSTEIIIAYPTNEKRRADIFSDVLNSQLFKVTLVSF